MDKMRIIRYKIALVLIGEKKQMLQQPLVWEKPPTKIEKIWLTERSGGHRRKKECKEVETDIQEMVKGGRFRDLQGRGEQKDAKSIAIIVKREGGNVDTIHINVCRKEGILFKG